MSEISRDTNEAIANLVMRLAMLAYEWRGADDDEVEANQLVWEYHKTMATLWQMGWDGEDLTVEEELPFKLMPDYFQERWRGTLFHKDFLP